MAPPSAGVRWFERTFQSLWVRNFRFFFAGQLVSVVGLFMDYTARAWLVLELTGDGTAVGLTIGLTFAPLMLLGPWAGVVVDRVNKRRLVLAAQAVLAVSALLLGVLVLVDVIEMWMVYSIALVSGTATAFENPARRSFMSEIVGREDAANAVSLNSSVVAIARGGGPALAGLVIAAFGVAPAFLANGVSYLASMGALLAMNPKELHRTAPVPKRPGQLREGLRYVARTRSVGVPLVLMAVVGTLALNYPVSVPLITTRVFEAGPATFGTALGLLAFGGFLGALYIAGRSAKLSIRMLGAIAIAFGLCTLAASAAPTVETFMGLLMLTGMTGTAFSVACNGLIQRDVTPQMSGRVLALFSVAFIGTATIGSPVVGLVAELIHPRVGLAIGGVFALLAGVVTVVESSRRARGRSSGTTATFAAGR